MFFILLFTTLIIFSIFVYTIHCKTVKTLKQYKNIPRPSAIPIFGNILHFVNDDNESLQKRIKDYFNEIADTYLIYCSWQYIVVTSNPKVFEEILSSPNKHMQKNCIYDLLRPWLNEGLLLSVEHKWHSRRKIITPAFHFKILESFVPIFEREGDKLIDNIKKLNSKEDESYDILEFIAGVTLNNIAETSMGVTVDNHVSVYSKACKEMGDTVSRRFVKIYWRSDILCYIFKNDLFTEFKAALRNLHKFTEKTIVERRHFLTNSLQQKTNENREEINEFGQKKRMVFLDILLQSTIDGKPLTNADIREEVDTFMFAGHDTTTSALCFTLWLLSRHQDVQKKIFNEIIEVIGYDKNKPLDYRELQDLKYLDLVIKESLRLYPPVAVIGRTITEDSIIDGKFYPKGTEVILHLMQLMRNPKVFDNPNEFIPERHCSIDYFDVNPYSYVPFSAGPRNCIGQKYAMLELKSVITKVLRHFELLPNGPDIRPVISIVLKSMTGFHVSLKERQYYNLR